MSEEGSNNIFNLLVAELEVITIEFNEFDATSLIKCLESDVVLLVKLSLFHWEDCAIGLKFMEPSSFFGIDHGVVGEHNKECACEGGEAAIDYRGAVFWALIVQVR